MADQERDYCRRHVMQQMVNGQRGAPTTVTCAGGGGGNVGDPVESGGAGTGGASSATFTGAGGYGNSHGRRGAPTTVTCAGGGDGNVGDPVEITVTDKQWPNTPTRPLVGPISWRVMPAADGQIIIHFECEKDTDRWWMMYLTADAWNAFKRAGDLMFDEDQTGRA